MKITSPLHVLAALAIGAALPSAELQRAHVPAQARWVGHFDLQAFQRSTLWQRLGASAEFQHETMPELEHLEAALGIDPFRDLFSVTVYGLGASEEDAVLLLETSPAIDTALEALAHEGQHRTTTQQGLLVHSWGDEGCAHVVERGERRIVVVAQEVDDLVEGVRVLQGQARSLAGEPTARLTAAPLASSFLFFAAIDGIPGLAELHPDSRVAGMATGIVLDVGEAAGELVLRASVQTHDVDAALDLGDVCDGLIALGRLALSSHEVPTEVSEIVRALRVEARGTEVWVEFQFPVERLLAIFAMLHEEEGE